MNATDDGGFGADEQDWWVGSKARVFISCGQKFDEEKRLARETRSLIRRLGFAPYLAFRVQASKALTEGIYARLRTADYFLFVDFVREVLDSTTDRRGSIFSNQELAIASYLELDSLYFVEAGVKQRDGIIGAIQGNAIRFSDRSKLLSQVEEGIHEALWGASQRHELRIERNPTQFSHARLPVDAAETQWVEALYYHIGLRNLHERTLATGCIVQVLKIRDLTHGTESTPDPVEMKFKHINLPIVSIPPGSTRQFDGMFVTFPAPQTAILGIFSRTYIDSQDAVRQHTLNGPGDFEVDLVAFSREFSPARATLLVHLGTKIDDVRFSLKPFAIPSAPAQIGTGSESVD
ncbi:MAG: hypothetical protein WCB19_07305 [Thermoplasmata archaeon]